MPAPRALPDQADTIAAVASPPGAAPRAIVRIAGPDAMRVLERLIGEPAPTRPARLGGRAVKVMLAGRTLETPVDALAWPGRRSYTRQPSAELHTVGSPPVVDAVLAAVGTAGARLAERGEFTLRALLAGRIDLTQAEAVLGVIDAADETELQAALAQLSGGLAGPLDRLREDLADLLAELEAGLDFVDEEDIRFVEPEELLGRLARARRAVAAVAEQSTGRGVRGRLPRVVLVGPPNAGKSSLHNALAGRFGVAERPSASVVSPQAGTTRDCLAATLEVEGVRLELLDTAGVGGAAIDAVDALARAQTEAAAREADFVVACRSPEAGDEAPAEPNLAAPVLLIATKADLAAGASTGLATSSVTGEGIERLGRTIAGQVSSIGGQRSAMVADTAERCAGSLAAAADSLAAAEAIAPTGQHELVACELRAALDGLGRVTGAVTTDDLLDRIFSRFCIGK